MVVASVSLDLDEKESINMLLTFIADSCDTLIISIPSCNRITSACTMTDKTAILN